MKVALIERLKDGKKIEIRDLDEGKLISSFANIGERDIYDGFIAANSYGDEFYITIVNFE